MQPTNPKITQEFTITDGPLAHSHQAETQVVTNHSIDPHHKPSSTETRLLNNCQLQVHTCLMRFPAVRWALSNHNHYCICCKLSPPQFHQKAHYTAAGLALFSLCVEPRDHHSLCIVENCTKESFHHCWTCAIWSLLGPIPTMRTSTIVTDHCLDCL